MKKYVALSLLDGMTVLAGLALAADDASKADTDKYTGTWTIVSLEVDGMKAPEDQIKGMKVVLEPGKYTIKKDGKTLETGTYKLDASKKPKAIESTPADGDDKGKQFLGIYEIDGDNSKVCFSTPGKDRPTEFATKKDAGKLLYIMKRDKP